MDLFSKNNDDAIVILLVNHQTDLSAYIRSLIPTANSSVQDVLQRVNIIIWEKRSMFEIGTNFKAWAFNIARWQVKAFLTENKRNSWLIINDHLTAKITNHMADTTDTHGNQSSMHQMRRALELCIKLLKEKDQALLLERYYGNKTLRQYADETQQSLGALKVTLHRIRAKLRKCIEHRTQLT